MPAQKNIHIEIFRPSDYIQVYSPVSNFPSLGEKCTDRLTTSQLQAGYRNNTSFLGSYGILYKGNVPGTHFDVYVDLITPSYLSFVFTLNYKRQSDILILPQSFYIYILV
jgi:hypothetical protein